MRNIFFTAIIFFTLSLPAQKPTFTPTSFSSQKGSVSEGTEENKGDAYQDLYQQYLNSYEGDQQAEPQQPAAQTSAPSQEAEPAPVQAQPAQPQEAAAQTPAPAAASDEFVSEEQDDRPETETEKISLKPFVVAPYFSIALFGKVLNGVYIFGDDVLSSSYGFALENAIIDLKGGNKMFNGRILLDFSKGFKTNKLVAINYEHDPSLPTDGTNPVEFDVTGDAPNSLDVLQNVSFKFVHPSYRTPDNAFGLNVNLQAGLFTAPFGIENDYDHERTFSKDSLIRNSFLGRGFNDLGLSLGVDFLFSNEMDLALLFFIFNGDNEVMLDGQNLFKDPAFGFDLRYGYKSDFYVEAAFSFIYGSAYHDYDETVEGGIFQTTDKTYLNEETKLEDEYILKDSTRNDYALNKKNALIALALDLGYNVDPEIVVGLKTEFVLSSRSLFNPNVNIFIDNELAGNARFIRDATNHMLPNGSYFTWGILAAPYARIYMFDLTARISYNKSPYLYSFIKDNENSTLGFDLDIVYRFCDYASLFLNYSFIRETMYKYDKTYTASTGNSYYKNVYNHNQILLSLSLNYDFLWKKR